MVSAVDCEPIQELARHALVGVWVAGWALALRFLLWKKNKSSSALQGDSNFVLPAAWRNALAATAVLTVGDTFLSGLFGLTTTIGTAAIAAPFIAVAIYTLHARTHSVFQCICGTYSHGF